MEVPQEAYNQWQEALNFPEKRSDVKAAYMRGLKFPDTPEPQDRWVKPNYEQGAFKYYRWNPDYSRKQRTATQKLDQSPTQTPAADRTGQTAPQKQSRQEQRPAAPRRRSGKSKGIGGQ